MADFNYPSASFGQAIELPIPPIGNSTGFGTNIPGTTVPNYSTTNGNSILPTLPSLSSIGDTVNNYLNTINPNAPPSEGFGLPSYAGTGDVANTVAASAQSANSILGIPVSRVATIIVGLIALIAGFWLLGSTSLTDAVRSLKPA